MRQSSSSRPQLRQNADARPSLGRRLTQIAFVLSIALVICRLLMPETIRSPVDALAALSVQQPTAGAHDQPAGSFTGTMPVPPAAESLANSPASQDPGPATGLILDLLACIPALLVLTRRAIDPDYQLLTSRSMIPMALLGILAALSPLWAADRFASVVSASHLLCALVFLWSTLQLVRSWRHLRMIAGSLVGLLIVLSLIGYNFRLVELPFMRESFNNEKSAILIQHDFKPGTFEAKMFENRIVQGQPMGYSMSPNTYAALLVMLGVVAAGVVIQRGADADGWIWLVSAALIATAVAAIIPLIRWTQCRAAYATPVLAAMILFALWPLRRILARYFRTAYFTGVIAIAASAAFVIHHGVRYGNLWHDSLNFRLHYWIGSFRVLTEGFYHASRQFSHFFFGVGWENFGSWYLGQRLAIAPEEIRDPHNFIVRVFVELGVVGGFLLLVWMLLLWWDLTRPAPAEENTPTPQPNRPTPKPQRPIPASPLPNPHSAWRTLAPLGAIAFAAIAMNIAAATDFNAGGSYIVLELAKAALFFTILVAGLMMTTLRKSGGAIGRPLRETQFELDDRPAPWLVYAMLAALATFLVHNLIEFSLFEPGPMFLFALITGAVLSVRAQGRRQIAPTPVLEKPPGLRAARIGLALGVLAWLAAAALIVTPVVMAESLAQEADANILRFAKTHEGPLLIQASREISDAARLVPFNADYAHRAAGCLLSAGSDLQRVSQMVDAAIAADPMSVRDFHMRAQLKLQHLHDPFGGLADYRRAVMLDPRNVRMGLEFAAALLGVAKRQHRPDLAKEAALQYECALDNNNQLAPAEVKRLNPQEMEQARKGKAEAEEIARRR